MSELPDDLRDEVIADLSTLLTRIHFPENARLLASVIERLHALPGWQDECVRQALPGPSGADSDRRRPHGKASSCEASPSTVS